MNLPAYPEITPLSLLDALPILRAAVVDLHLDRDGALRAERLHRKGLGLRVERLELEFPAREAQLVGHVGPDRKSTRLNSSHLVISYAVFCLKKKITSTLLKLYS